MIRKSNCKILLIKRIRKKRQNRSKREIKYLDSSKQLNKERNKESKLKIEIKEKWSKEEERSKNISKINKIS